MTKQLVLSLISVALFGCSHPNDSNSSFHDPSVLIDTYEREITKSCDGSVVSDQVVRHAAYSTIKINPDQNIYIAAASFFNLDNGAELTPKAVWFPGPGGDNLKRVTFCQAPRPSSDCLVVHDGDNQIEYKYWSQENPDVMGEDKIRTLHFTVSSETSAKTCTRVETVCPPMAGTSSYSDCGY